MVDRFCVLTIKKTYLQYRIAIIKLVDLRRKVFRSGYCYIRDEVEREFFMELERLKSEGVFVSIPSHAVGVILYREKSGQDYWYVIFGRHNFNDERDFLVIDTSKVVLFKMLFFKNLDEVHVPIVEAYGEWNDRKIDLGVLVDKILRGEVR